jgi:hypothetical protein
MSDRKKVEDRASIKARASSNSPPVTNRQLVPVWMCARHPMLAVAMTYGESDSTQ